MAALAAAGGPMTMNAVATATGRAKHKLAEALAELVTAGKVERCDVMARGRIWDAYRLARQAKTA